MFPSDDKSLWIKNDTTLGWDLPFSPISFQNGSEGGTRKPGLERKSIPKGNQSLGPAISVYGTTSGVTDRASRVHPDESFTQPLLVRSP